MTQPYNILIVFALFIHSFEKDEDAQSAVESTESFVLDGRVLSVQFARGSKRGEWQDRITCKQRPSSNLELQLTPAYILRLGAHQVRR